MADPATAQLLAAITAALADPAPTAATALSGAGTATPYAGTTALADELIALARSGGDTTALADELVAMARSELPAQTGAAINTLETITASGDFAAGGGAALFGELAQAAPLAAVVVQALLQGSEPEAVVASMAPAAIQGYKQASMSAIADAVAPATDVAAVTDAIAPATDLAGIADAASAQALSGAAEPFAQTAAQAGDWAEAATGYADAAASLPQQQAAALAQQALDGTPLAAAADQVEGLANQARQVENLVDAAKSPASALQTRLPEDVMPASVAAQVDDWTDAVRGDAGAIESPLPAAPTWRDRLRDDAPVAEDTPVRADGSNALRQPSPASAAWPVALDSHERLITLQTPLELPLEVERFNGHEAVCAAFKFEIDCLSPSAFLDLQPLLGQPLQLDLRAADNQQRHWHGYCTEVAPLGSDGGLARYRLTLEPWTAFLRLRRNALIFQDMDVLGVVERVFADYPQAKFRSEVTQALPTRAIITQYRETDEAFVTRLLSEAGLAWRFEQPAPGTVDAESGSDNGDGGEASSHVLVIFDRNAELPTATPDTLRFHRIDATEREDAISHFAEQRQAVPDAVGTASWQAEQVEALSASSSADPVGPGVPSREVYTVPRAGRHASSDQVQLHADLMLDALRLPQRLHAGAGSGRGLAPGAAFTLSQHPDLSGQAFVPLAVEHVAVNNLGSGVVALLDDPGLERGSYRNRFLAVPQGTPNVPAHRPKPLAPGAQTARVVGLPDAANTATRDHQVRIQFAWQRGTTPNAGGLTDAASSGTPDGHAPGNERSGTWVRVAEWLAGPNWGSHTLPRLDSEVLVEFLHADIDQPLVTGQLYNGQVALPFALADASNHPGTLSGLHHGGVDGSGHQQWLVDDAPGQLRQRLATTLADSRVELGYLIQHADSNRGSYRGQGFELATAGWGNLHAGQGLLLSSTARTGHTSTQLDVTEAVGQLKAAEERAKALSDAAVQQQVPALSANTQQSALLKSVDPEQDGKYSGSIGGQPATKPKDGARDGGDPVERFATPLLLAESPDSIAAATPKSALAYAGGALHLTAQDDTHLAAGHTFAAVAGGPAALYTHAGPLRVIAANGPVTVQAHTGELELLADQSVTVTATDDRIDVLAQTKIVLQAGQSQIILDGGDIRFECPGNFTVKASQHPWLGGEGNAAALPSLPTGLMQPNGSYPFSV